MGISNVDPRVILTGLGLKPEEEQPLTCEARSANVLELAQHAAIYLARQFDICTSARYVFSVNSFQGGVWSRELQEELYGPTAIRGPEWSRLPTHELLVMLTGMCTWVGATQFITHADRLRMIAFGLVEFQLKQSAVAHSHDLIAASCMTCSHVLRGYEQLVQQALRLLKTWSD